MNKKFIASLALVSFFLSRCPCPLQAEASERVMNPTESNQTVPPASPPAEADSAADPNASNGAAPSQASPQAPLGPEDGDEDEEPKGTPVAPSDVDPQKSSSKKFWTNILIAGVAVLVAVVSILVVSNNNGSKN